MENCILCYLKCITFANWWHHKFSKSCAKQFFVLHFEVFSMEKVMMFYLHFSHIHHDGNHAKNVMEKQFDAF